MPTPTYANIGLRRVNSVECTTYMVLDVPNDGTCAADERRLVLFLFNTLIHTLDAVHSHLVGERWHSG